MIEATVGTGEGVVKTYPVKDTWFKGWLKGNSMWPQIGLGILPFATEAVLRDPPQSWEQFTNSRLSEDQVARAMQGVAHLHAGYGVKYYPGSRIHGYDYVIPTERVHEMWDAVSTNVVNHLHVLDTFPVEGAVEVERTEMSELVGVMSAVRTAFLSESGVRAAEIYRDSYRDEGIKKVRERAGRLAQLLIENNWSEGVDCSERVLCQKFMKEQVYKQVQREMPYVESRYRQWLGQLMHC